MLLLKIRLGVLLISLPVKKLWVVNGSTRLKENLTAVLDDTKLVILGHKQIKS